MTRFIVVRHGRSVANDAHVFSSTIDVSLTPGGLKQAQYLGEYLAKNERIDKIYTSGMLRTNQTAAPTAERLGLPLHEEPGLREIFSGLWEGVPYATLLRDYTAEYLTWIHDFSHARCTGGESVRELYFRVKKTLDRLAAQNGGKTVMLATHFSPLRVIIALAMGYSCDEVHLAQHPHNAAVNIFRYENGCLTPEVLDLIPYPATLSTSPPPFVLRKKQ